MATIRSGAMLWILLFSVLCEAENRVQLEDKTLYLNSPENCSGMIVYVHPNTTYHVREDVSPYSKTTSVRECKLTFTSDSRLCFRQEGNLTDIADPNVDLIILSGTSHDSNDETLMTYNSKASTRTGISFSERCLAEGKDFLSIHLHLKSQKNIDISKLLVNLAVQTIDNPTRYAYFSHYYHGFDLDMQNSIFTVFNRPEVSPPQFYGLGDAKFNQLTNFKLKTARGSNRTFCFYYKPLVDFNCASDWNITVLETTRGPPTPIWTIRCINQASHEITAKCLTPAMHEVILAFQRVEDAILLYDSRQLELPHMFMLAVVDYTSSNTQGFIHHVETTFRNLVPPVGVRYNYDSARTTLNPVVTTLIGTSSGHTSSTSGTPSVGGLSITWIILIAVVSLLIIVGIVFAIRSAQKRRQGTPPEPEEEDPCM